MTLTHLDLDRIEGLAGRLTAARSRFAAYTDTPSVVFAVPGTDRLAVLRDDVLMAQYRLAEAASDLTALITCIRELEGALDKADALIKFWRDYRELPGDQFHDKYQMDSATSSLRMTELAHQYAEARTALQRKTP